MADLDRPPDPPNENENEWTTVNNKRNNLSKVKQPNPNDSTSNMIKTKLSITIRVPNDPPADFSATDIHFATLRELSKQDKNMVFLNATGEYQVNIFKSYNHDTYKNFFQPREKAFPTGGGQISISHYILSEIQTFNKTLMIPFLRTNKVFIYFNQRDGLEHFTVIGVLFGPHPDYSWRQDIVESLEQTIRADITDEEKTALSKTTTEPKIVISLIPQQLSNPKRSETKSVALEVRVPADQERIYIQILDRLNERKARLEEGDIDIVLDEKVGFFFPYYAKAERRNLFDKLMKKQNAEMYGTSVIPVFGFTTAAQNYPVKIDDEVASLILAIKSNYGVYDVVKTASSATVGKYLVIVNRLEREIVEEFLDELFQQLPDFPDHPANFTKPQRGGNAFKQTRINNISSYLTKLEEKVDEELFDIQDEEIQTPPKQRNRRFTVSYAQAAKTLQFNAANPLSNPSPSARNNTTDTLATATSTLTNSLFHETLAKLRSDTESSMNLLRQDMAKEIAEMESRITASVIKALNTPTEISMSHTDTASEYTAAQDARTVATLSDKVEELAELVKNLADTVHHSMATSPGQPKRTRNPPSTTNNTSSPPSKYYRSRPPTPPSTPPPNGHPTNFTEGAREAS